MHELYSTLRPSEILGLMVLTLIALGVEGAYMVSLWGNRKRMFFEGLVFSQLFLISVLLRKINGSLSYPTVLVAAYQRERVFLLLISLVSGFYLYMKNKRIGLTSGIIIILGLTAGVNKLPYGVTTLLVILSILTSIIRAGWLHFIKNPQSYEERIDRHSIKEALDSQTNGIMFVEKEGNILLVNKQMLLLMKEVGGQHFRNGQIFWDMLESKYKNNKYFQKENNNHTSLVVKTENESWQFSRKEIEFKSKLIYQITAANISEEEYLNRELERYNNYLEKQKNNLLETLENLEELRKGEAVSRYWEHIHGSLGQYISIIERLLKQDQDPSANIREIVKKIQVSLNTNEEEPVQDNFESLIDSFLTLGINIKLIGGFPEDKFIKETFVSIIKEGIVNAIRHGQAENISLYLLEEEHYCLEISNDGEEAPEKLTWGGGFRAIQSKVDELGGQLEIITRPNFLLRVEIPKNRKMDSMEVAYD